MKNRAWAKFCLLIAILIIPAALLYASGMFHFFLDREELTEFLQSLGVFSYIGFVLLQVFQVVAAPIPGEVTGFLGGFLYGVPMGILLSTLGLTIGSLLAFTLSKIFGRPLVEKVVKKETLDRYDYVLQSRGIILIFILFVVPGFPKDYLSYILGLGSLPIPIFLIVSSIGRLTGTTMLTLSGNFIRNEQYASFFTLASIAIIVVIVTIMYRDKIEVFLKKWVVRKPKV